MNTYETTIIIDSFLKSEDFGNLVKKIQDFITNNGGEIRKLQEWGKRRLAYEINRKQYGYYVHILFDAPRTLPNLLEHEYRLEESILRYLIVKSDPKALLKKDKMERLDKVVKAKVEPVFSEPIENEVPLDVDKLEEEEELIEPKKTEERSDSTKNSV